MAANQSPAAAGSRKRAPSSEPTRSIEDRPTASPADSGASGWPRQRAAAAGTAAPPQGQSAATADVQQQLLAQAGRHHQAGQLQEAECLYQDLLRLNPDHAEAWHLLGALADQQGNHQSAIAHIRRAIALRPQAACFHINLAKIFKAIHRYEDAVDTYRQIIERQPDCVDARIGLGTVLELQGRFEEAEEVYLQALRIQPRNAQLLGKLAFFYEAANQLGQAQATAARGLEVDPHHLLCHLVKAKCARRQGRRSEALQILESLYRRQPAAANDKALLFELGRLHDLQGDSEQAFRHLARANQIAHRTYRRHADAHRELRRVETLREAFDDRRVCCWSKVPPCDAERTPIFVIGFPRSGTTLLDQILDSHPRLQTLHEAPTVETLEKLVDHFPQGYPHALAELSEQQVHQLREAYFRVADNLLRRQAGVQLVDTNPLNMKRVGLILRVFPSARFVMVLRHPCDVCLSCFMQDFVLSDAMANFCTLQDSARLYVRLFELWRNYLRVLPHLCHIVRYEQLVVDLEGEGRRLTDFLELNWHAQLLDFAQHARRRGKIKTPSYYQVTQPIYRDACHRWQRYARHVQTVLPVLQPWIEYLGYAKPG